MSSANNNRILEVHSKTVVTTGGFLLSVAGWFVWMCALSGVKATSFGPFIVRNAFLRNFGGKLSWWTAIFIQLGALMTAELVVQSIRRVYFPTDEDLMQRIEKDRDVKNIFKDNAQADERGNVFESEIPEEREQQELAIPRPSHRRERSKSPYTPRASTQEQRRNFASLTEEGEDMDRPGRAL